MPSSALLVGAAGNGRGGGRLATARLVDLQQTVGNRAVQRLIRRVASNAAAAVEAPEEALAGGPADSGSRVQRSTDDWFEDAGFSDAGEESDPAGQSEGSWAEGEAAGTEAAPSGATPWYEGPEPSDYEGPEPSDGGGSISGPAPPHQKDAFQLPSYLMDPPEVSPEAVIHFPVDVDRLDFQDQMVLRDFAERHRDDIQQGRIRITIRGFADQRADDPYNLDLSERRAKQVDEHLRREFARQEIISAPGGPIGYRSEVQARGEEVSDATPEALARTRRVEIHVERFDPLPTQDPKDPQSGDQVFPLSRNWRGKIVQGGSGGAGPGQAELYILRIQDLTSGGGADFVFKGAGGGVGTPLGAGYASGSDWDYFTTDAAVRLSDFEGPATHASFSAVASSGDTFKIEYSWYEQGKMQHGEANLNFLEVAFQVATPGASITDGTLEMISLK